MLTWFSLHPRTKCQVFLGFLGKVALVGAFLVSLVVLFTGTADPLLVVDCPPARKYLLVFFLFKCLIDFYLPALVDKSPQFVMFVPHNIG